MHHIVSDGWSTGVLFRELSSLYESGISGEVSHLQELQVQYADFSAWQRRWLRGEVLDSQLSYWKQQLSDLPVLELPTDRPRPPVRSDLGALQRIHLSAPVTQRLKQLSRQSNATPFMTLLAAFNVLLHRYSSQLDIIVGTPIAGRTRSELEPLIGFFVNTLALRTKLSHSDTFSGVLARVRQAALEAYQHQDLPFERLVEELGVERSLSRTPVFQAMFAFQTAAAHPPRMSHLDVSRLVVEAATEKFDLTLVLRGESETIEGMLSYSTDLFDSTTAAMFVRHFRILIEQVVADPAGRLSDIELLAEAERQQIIVEWNDTERSYPLDQCLHESIEAQVDRAPDTIAISFDGSSTTYLELNRRANQFARYLLQLGVRPGAIVGVCLERSVEMLVGFLAVLKVGGAYLPLDPEHPTDRLVFMLQDTEARILITQPTLADRFGVWNYERGNAADSDADTSQNPRVVYLEDAWQWVQLQSDDNLTNYALPQSLAYVMYTSGSTGTPKGISISHQAIKRLVLNPGYIDIGSNDKIAQAANSSFDATTFEIFGALVHGAQMVIFDKEVTLSPEVFAHQLRSYDISTLFLTTALFNLLASETPQVFSSLRNLLFGGEAVDPGWVRKVLREGPPERLLHVYGPTESTTFATWHRVRHVPAGATSVPIGSPVGNTQVYVLDKNLRSMPVGSPGELYIGGDGLASGYFNRAALSAEKFIPNPFSSNPGARMYRTGDLVCFRSEGVIEFLGRIDHQVKIRGFRIELGEIESVLALHPLVTQAVVLARDLHQGTTSLVAYLQLHTPNQDWDESCGLISGSGCPITCCPPSGSD